MNEQLQLTIDEPIPNNPDRRNLRRDTGQWIKANPKAYHALAKDALVLVRAGHKVSIKMIFEHARYKWTLESNPGQYDDRFKLNNNWTAYVARHMAMDYPELRKAFKFRKTFY